ncbi:MAG: hypothetical protein R3E66_20430 [bacterium]
MSDPHSIPEFSSLMAFFREELVIALKETGTQTSEETEAYLVHMLDGFGKLTPEVAPALGFDRPTAHMLQEAMEAQGDRRIEIYRRLGDVSLYSCGFFEAKLKRTTVGTQYYHSVGRTAYKSLSTMMAFKQPGGAFDGIFTELSEKFDEVVSALRVLSGRGIGSSIDVLVGKWQSGDLQAESALAHGLLPGRGVGHT